MSEVVYPLKLPRVSNLPSASVHRDRLVCRNSDVFFSDAIRWNRFAKVTEGVVTIYVDNVNGSDTTGNGTSNAPFATFGRALQEIGPFIDGRVTIILKASPVSYGVLDISGITRRNPNASLTVQGEMSVLTSGTITSFSNSVDDPVYGSAVKVARIKDDSKTWNDNQFKHKILQVYRGPLNYYRVITHNDVNSLYCSYVFWGTINNTWSYQVLEWQTFCRGIRISDTNLYVNVYDLFVDRDSSSPITGALEVVNSVGQLLVSRVYIRQNFHFYSVLTDSFLTLNACVINRNHAPHYVAFSPSGMGAGIHLIGTIIENEVVGLVNTNNFRFVTMYITDGTRVYRGAFNPSVLFSLDTPSSIVFSNQLGQVVCDAGSTCLSLQQGAIARNISSVYFGSNVTTKYVINQDAVSGGVRGLLGSYVGSNITNPEQLHSRLQVAGSVATQVTTITANTTLGPDHHIVLVDASGGSRIITLPNASTCNGRQYIIKKIDSSTNTVTIVPQSGQTIDGATSQLLTLQYQYIGIVSNGSNWFRIM